MKSQIDVYAYYQQHPELYSHKLISLMFTYYVDFEDNISKDYTLDPLLYIATYNDLIHIIRNLRPEDDKHLEEFVTNSGNYHYNDIGKIEILNEKRHLCPIFCPWKYVASNLVLKDFFWDETINSLDINRVILHYIFEEHNLSYDLSISKNEAMKTVLQYK